MTLDEAQAILDEIKGNRPDVVSRAKLCMAVTQAVKLSVLEYEMTDAEVMSVIAGLGLMACEAIPGVTPDRIAGEVQRMIEIKTLVRAKPEGGVQ